MSERILIALVDFKTTEQWLLKDISFEIKELVSACHGEVVGDIVCPTSKPNAATLIQKGKLDEIVALVSVVEADTVVFSCELKGHHQRNLQEAIGVKVLDRTALILDIFARRAKSMEGKLQVELAQLKYRLPRLVGGYKGLSRLGGGIGTLGPGETKLEADRRKINYRIVQVKKELKLVQKTRATKRGQRIRQRIPLVSLVGYTNAGKSTLLNKLTSANQQEHDGLFTTLDSVSRQCVLPHNCKVVFSDTVGFLHDLPHGLVEAFHATLEEVQVSDLLLHVLDISNTNHKALKESVDDVLRSLDALHKPTILVLNKIDQVEDEDVLSVALHQYPNAIALSAKKSFNFDELLEKVEGVLSDSVLIDAFLSLTKMSLVSLAHQYGEVLAEQYTSEGIHLRARVPHHLAGKFSV